MSAATSPLDALRASLAVAAPRLAGAILGDLSNWLVGDPRPSGPEAALRDFNDPIWKIVTLTGEQVLVADMRLMQRLRRVRQLGLAHLVYTGAHHSRFEHSIGSMHAAALMCDRLSAASGAPRAVADKLRQVVCLAALLHDCGHTCFSHVGERVLADVFHDEFEAIASAFDAAFPDTLADGAQRAPRKRPPAAELLSALLTISPAMEAALKGHALTYPTPTALFMACGLILGRPYNLEAGQESYHFAKGIVSGDLDADKVDYVARDAFYAGIPTATDTNRLLSQLTAVRFTRDTRVVGFSPPADQSKLFKQGAPERYHLLGIKPSGASSLEMFVMTRAYLHDRIYGHQKTRAAEMLLERLLRQSLMHLKTNMGWDEAAILRLMFDPSGDDGLLGRIQAGLPGDDGSLADLASRILDRRLPVRAIAISQRTMAEFDGAEMRPKTSFLLPWALAEEELAGEPESFEDAICGMTGLRPGKDVLVDWPRANPVKERPDLWVSDPQDGDGPLYRVNHFFDVEQLSNAYRDVKLVGWVFAWPEDKAAVAAAAGAQLANRFDLQPGPEAFRRAKVSQAALDDARDRLVTTLPPGPERDAVNGLCLSTGQTIRPPPEIFGNLAGLRVQDATAVATRLAKAIADARLDRAYYDDLFVAVEVLKTLLVHCVVYDKHAVFKDDVAPGNERRFQQHVLDYCRKDERCCNLFEVTEATKAAGGITDLLFTTKKGRRETVVVELKSSGKAARELYQSHAGQPMQYAAKGFARVSLLYCQYADDLAVAVADTLDVRANAPGASTLAVLCLGQQAFWDVPSALGRAPAG